MTQTTNWQLWKVEEIVERLPALLEQVETNRDAFEEDFLEQNASALESLRFQPPTVVEINQRQRTRELASLGFCLQILAQKWANERDYAASLDAWRAAYELYRGGDPSQRNRTMRYALTRAIRILALMRSAAIAAGTTDAALVHQELQSLVRSAWGIVPARLSLTIDATLLEELERLRTEREEDTAFQEQLVRDNVELVLSLEIPSRLQSVQDRWRSIGEHVAPAAVRLAHATLRQPRKLSEILRPDTIAQIESAVARADIGALAQSLEEVEEALETNLELRLDAKPEYREPLSELRYKGQADRFFVEARRLLLAQDSRALSKFREIHFRRSNMIVAKEWYAYALTLFGRSTDIFDIIELLEEVISSRYYNSNWHWSARWNLAVALKRIPPRADEALDILLPVLDNDSHPPEVFELCLLWALEQDRNDVLSELLLKSPCYEAHLLAALYEARDVVGSSDASSFWPHFRRTNRILRDLDVVFPNPIERLSPDDLDQLTRDFIQNSLVSAGVEWFQQRLSDPNEQRYFKNWECAGRLHEERDDFGAAWRCYERQWFATYKNPRTPEHIKTEVLRSLMTWALRHKFEEDAARLLTRDWRHTNMDRGDVDLILSRLNRTPPPAPPSREKAPEPSAPKLAERDSQPEQVQMSREDAERVIQEKANLFLRTGNVRTLAEQAEDAFALLEAVAVKHEAIPANAVNAMREIIGLASRFREGVNEQEGQRIATQMKNQLESLQADLAKMPYELAGLAGACERVAQNLAVRVKAVPDLYITPPQDLKLTLATPEAGEAYTTFLFTRIANPGSEAAEDLTIAVTSLSEAVRVLEAEVIVSQLAGGASIVVDSPVAIEQPNEEAAELSIHITYSIGGVPKTTHATSRMIFARPPDPVPVFQRYITTAPVSVDRSDLFHGRAKELRDLKSVMAGGILRKLYFVNGIRRVGKSSLMQHLGSRLAADVLPLLLNVETILSGQQMDATQFVRQLMRTSIRMAQELCGPDKIVLGVPGAEQFALDPPWVVFDDFLHELRKQSGYRNVLLCFDEVQHLVERIADPNDAMDDGFLSWLRGKTQAMSDTLIICTGSESYATLRKRHEHTLWGNMEPYNVSFVSKGAMKDIATKPVAQDNVHWLPEAIERLWEVTEGHPWVTQVLAEKVTERLNSEYRRVVGPGDIDRAVELVSTTDARVAEYWWNERQGLVTETHRAIAFLILQNQAASGKGVSESELAQLCAKAGISHVGRYLEEMKAVEVLTNVETDGEQYWRLRGGFLERYVTTLFQRAMRDSNTRATDTLPNQPLALLLDWENVKIGLAEVAQDPQHSASGDAGPETEELARRLLAAASRHGAPRQRWAVANWENSFFQGDQSALRRGANFWTDLSGEHKKDASDHVLRQKIHWVLREQPDISVFVIATGDADFGEDIKTLQEKGKRVILWSTRDSLNPVYRYFLSGPDAIQIEWLEDIVFGSD